MMHEGQGPLLVIGLVMLSFLAWGLDPVWRDFVIRTESKGLIDTFGSEAFTLGQMADLAARSLLGDYYHSEEEGFNRGLTLGVREIIARLLMLRAFGALILLGLVGVIHESVAMQTLRLERFEYTSPIAHRRARRSVLYLFGLLLLLVAAPLPLPTWLLPGLCLWLMVAYARKRTLSMKQ